MKIFDKTALYEVFINNYGLIIMLSLLFIGDTLTSVFFEDNLRFSFGFKTVIILMLLLNLVSSNKELLIGIIFLSICLGLGMFLNYQHDYLAKTALFFEYISGLLFFNYLSMRDKKKELTTICSIVFMFYCATTILVFLLQIDYFKTYYGPRFGYMPFFNSQNEFSFIMIAIVCFFYQKYLAVPSTFNLLLSLIAIISSLLVGTKVLYIFTLLFVLYIFFKHLKVKIFLVLSIAILTALYFTREPLLDFLKIHFKVITDVYSKYGFINAISSLRYDYFQERINCQMAHMQFYNYLFGGIDIDCISEMSLIDILLTFGIIGSIVYFYLLKKFIVDNLKLNHLGYFFIIAITVMSFLSGYFFENLSAQFYVICVLYIYYYPVDHFFLNTKE